MSDYGWFAVKGLGYLVLIGLICWWVHSAVPLWALLLMPSWKHNDCKCNAQSEEVRK